MNAIVKKNGISYGIILAVISVLGATLVYSLNLYTSWAAGLGFMVVYLVILIMAVAKTKKQLNGQITFKEAFTAFFIAVLIMLAVSTVFNIVLYNVIDPGAKETIKEQTIKTTVSMLEKMNMPASQINKTVEELQKQDNYSPEKQAFGFLIGLCVSSLLGLLLALIFRSRPAQNE